MILVEGVAAAGGDERLEVGVAGGVYKNDILPNVS